jgi:signal transduction histidine kinase
VIVSLQAFHGNHVAAIAWALLGTALALGEVTATHADLVASAARRVHEQERASLAREIHDVVAHQLSAIAVQAGAARFAAADDAQAAVRAVAVIERNARSGLAELNTLVRQLRRVDQPGDGDDRTPRVPRLDDLPGLVTRAAQSGLRAELLIDGQPRPLPDAVELAGYRVVQECLTNAIRHAGGTAMTVTLRYGDDGLVIEVADDGPAETSTAEVSPAEISTAEPSGASRSGGGAGLAGLGERVRLLGGELETGRRHRGFAVRAFLPSHR